MLFVLPGFVLIGIVCIAVWALFFRGALRYERAVQNARQRHADFERRLASPGEPLYCLACREVFAGPLPLTGCPHCDIRAFVVPACASSDPAVVRRGAEFAARRAEAAPMNHTTADCEPSQSPAEVLHQGKQNP